MRKSYHRSTFRSGLLIGLSIPALVFGIYQSALTPTKAHLLLRNPGFQPHIRESMPAWDALLFVYGVFFVPVLFVLLLALNIVVWAKARVNYVFIFGGFLHF